jgi:N-methylhydantoinase A
MQDLIKEFHLKHEQLFGFSLDQPVEIVTLRVSAIGQMGSRHTPKIGDNVTTLEHAVIERREVYIDQEGSFLPCDIYDRESLSSGAIITGPAIIEGIDSTVVIEPSWEARIDDYGNCIIDRTQGGSL